MRGARARSGGRQRQLVRIGGVAVVLVLVLSSLLADVASSRGASSTGGPPAPSSSPTTCGRGTLSVVTFTESGLPSGTTWFVNLTYSGGTCAGSSNTLTITMSINDGTYPYTVASANKDYFSPGGSVPVNGATSVSVTFGLYTYPVKFTEQGLPRATSWSVTLGATTLTQTTASIAFAVPNGTYRFSVGSPGYQPSPGSGSVTVNGANKAQTISFSLVTYLVTFTRTGLPLGTEWWVNLTNGESHPSATTVVTWNEPNGTYYYTVASANKTYASPGSSFDVNGSSVEVNLSFALVTYAVVFTETGLPSGSLWNATLNGSTRSSTAGTIPFSEPNGSFAFAVEAPVGYRAVPASGNVSVRGANVTEPIGFRSSTSFFAVNFTETGLPAGTSWTVTLNGTARSSTTGTIAFSEPNGTYSFTVASPGYQPVPGSGRLLVNGAAVAQALTFTQVNYSVTFSESTLPAGTSWNVTLGRTTLSSSTGSIVFSEPNGTYAFSVSSPGYQPGPATGLVSVNGTAVSLSIAFTQVTYAVVFTETGLPAGTSWNATVGRTTESSTNGTIRFTEPNGTFRFTVAATGYEATPANGTLDVVGTSVNESISFLLATYTVTFAETGLPAGSSPGSGWSWAVTIGGTSFSSTNETIAVTEPNGVYAFSVSSSGYHPSPGSGSVTVHGAPVRQAIVFAQVTYAVTFAETGLPAGTSWNVTLDAARQSSTTGTIQFAEPNGTYGYTIGSSGWQPSPGSGGVTVTGAPTSQSIAFTQVLYAVTFTETGLPSGTSWSVSAGSKTSSSATPSIEFVLPNGTYAWSVGSLSGWYLTTPASGNLTVSGSPVATASVFVPTFSVPFNETGLPSGTPWSMTFTQAPVFAGNEPTAAGALFEQTFYSATSTLVAQLPNGTFAYVVHSASTFAPTAGGGILRVSGSATAAVPVTFAPGFAVTFAETGLPRGTAWAIAVNGATDSSPNSTIPVLLPSGTYDFTVGPVVGYVAASNSGSVDVNGAAASTTVPFAPAGSDYAVTFTETGLPAGTVWSVTIGSLTVPSRSASVVFQLPDGSYGFSTGAISGYGASPSTGTVTVNAAPASQAIAFSAVPTPTGTPIWVWIAIGVAAAAVVAGVAVALRMKRARR